MHTKRIILALAWPAIIDNLLHSLTHTADMIMVGRLGASSLAGVGLGGQVIFIFQSFMIAITAGTVAMVARSIGEENAQKARNVLEQSLVFGSCAALAATPLLYAFVDDFLQIYQAEADVIMLSTNYLRIAVFGTAFIFICLACAQSLRGAGDTRTPLIVSSTINMVNIGLNYLFIFGKGGFPAMGVKGAALGTTLAFIWGASLYFFLLLRNYLKISVSFRGFRPDVSTVKKVLHIGTPAALEQLVIQAGFLVFTVIITSFGTASIAAHQIGVRIQSFSFMPGFGFSMAATALVGQNLGAGHPEEAEKSGWEACKLAIGLMTVGGALLFIFAREIAVVFVSESAVIDKAVIFIRILAFGEPAIAIHFTLAGALRGAGDTKWPLYASTAGLYGL
ncbi:MAG: MATE family efflux transporter, partial [Theionarchaea archaeon]|nr:MATE family efflux transporter [Theionarchaea archaeon]